MINKLICFGDSFTEGVGLSYNETFVHIFETEKKLKSFIVLID